MFSSYWNHPTGAVARRELDASPGKMVKERDGAYQLENEQLKRELLDKDDIIRKLNATPTIKHGTYLTENKRLKRQLSQKEETIRELDSALISSKRRYPTVPSCARISMISIATPTEQLSDESYYDLEETHYTQIHHEYKPIDPAYPLHESIWLAKKSEQLKGMLDEMGRQSKTRQVGNGLLSTGRYYGDNCCQPSIIKETIDQYLMELSTTIRELQSSKKTIENKLEEIRQAVNSPGNTYSDTECSVYQSFSLNQGDVTDVHITNLTQSNSSLIEENERIRDELMRIKKDRTDLEQTYKVEIYDLKESLYQLTYDSKQEELKGKREFDTQKKVIARLRGDLDDAKKWNNDLEEANSRLMAKVDLLNSALDERSTTSKERDGRAEMASDMMENDHTEIEINTARYNTLLERFEKLQKKYDHQQAQITQDGDQHTSEVERRVTTLQSENTLLIKTNEQLQHSQSLAKDDVKKLRAQLADQEHKMLEAQTDARQIKKEREEDRLAFTSLRLEEEKTIDTIHQLRKNVTQLTDHRDELLKQLGQRELNQEKMEDNLMKSEKLVADLKAEVSTLTKEIHQLNDKHKLEIKQERDYISQLNAKLEEMETHSKALQERLHEVTANAAKLDEKYRNLVRDTSRDMAREISKDETKVENVSRKSRPSTIHQTYTELSFQVASNLKKKMAKPIGVEDGTWRRFLNTFFCELYMAAFNDMSTMRRQIILRISNLLRQPLSGMSMMTGAEMVDTQITSLPMATQEHLVNLLRDFSNEIDTSSRHQDVINQTVANARECMNAHADTEELCGHIDIVKLDQFIGDICKLAWQMANQQPSMTFSTEGLGQCANEDLQKILPIRGMDFSRVEDMVVEFYLEPTLMQGSQILEKGRVFLYVPQ